MDKMAIRNQLATWLARGLGRLADVLALINIHDACLR